MVFPASKPFSWVSGTRTWRQRSYNGSNQWITLYKNTGFSVQKFPLSLLRPLWHDSIILREIQIGIIMPVTSHIENMILVISLGSLLGHHRP